MARVGKAFVAALSVAALFASVAGAEAPAGPRLSFVRVDDRKLELVTTDPVGANPQVIAGGGEAAEPLPFIFSAPSWSADGAKVAFVGLTRLDAEARTDIYVVAADGSGLVKVPGTGETFDAVLSPDGGSVAFSRERKGRLGRNTVVGGTSVWLASPGGGKPREVVRWHGGVFSSPSSFSPDGSTLALTQDSRKRTAAVALSLVGKGRRVIARNAAEPVYSPDGTAVALLTVGRERTVKEKEGETTYAPTELAVADADGSDLRRLTGTPHLLELQPSWDPSGERLAYSQVRVGGGEAGFFGIGKPLMQINADGTCRQAFLSIRAAILFGATWQPGPGREVGPISC
jgi:Tol biopolymer transport system component